MSTNGLLSMNSISETRRSGRRGLAALAVLAIIAAGCSSESSNVARLEDGAILADVDAPGDVDVSGDAEPVNFRWDHLDDEFTTALSDLPEGAPFVVNFFASWCPSCIAEMPDFEAANQAFGGDVQFIGLAMQDRAESAQALVEDTGVSYLIGADPNGDIFAQLGGLSMPTTVFIDADRNVTSVFSGVLSEADLADKINNELLQES